MVACGIYLIKNEQVGRAYVGSSTSLNKRLARHKRDLNRRGHPNRHLQRAWNKYGAESFSFSVVEECPPEALEERENSWLQKMKAVAGVYNMTDSVDGHRGPANPFWSHRHTASAKSKMSAAKATMYCGSGNPNYGVKATEATRRLMSENSRNKRLSEADVVAIRSLVANGASHLEVAGQYGIGRPYVTRIANGTARTASDGKKPGENAEICRPKKSITSSPCTLAA